MTILVYVLYVCLVRFHSSVLFTAEIRCVYGVFCGTQSPVPHPILTNQYRHWYLSHSISFRCFTLFAFLFGQIKIHLFCQCVVFSINLQMNDTHTHKHISTNTNSFRPRICVYLYYSEIIACCMLPCIDMCSSFICFFFVALSLCLWRFIRFSGFLFLYHLIISLPSSLSSLSYFCRSSVIVYIAIHSIVLDLAHIIFFLHEIVNIYRTIVVVCRVIRLPRERER